MGQHLQRGQPFFLRYRAVDTQWIYAKKIPIYILIDCVGLNSKRNFKFIFLYRIKCIQCRWIILFNLFSKKNTGLLFHKSTSETQSTIFFSVEISFFSFVYLTVYYIDLFSGLSCPRGLFVRNILHFFPPIFL